MFQRQVQELKAGDVVFFPGQSRWLRVEKDPFRRGPDDPYMVVLCGWLGIAVIVLPEAKVFIRHRPWPEGKDEADMLDRVEKAAEEFVRMREVSQQDEDRTLNLLHEAIEAYELGKSMELAR